MVRFLVLVLVAVSCWISTASACQQILVDHPSIRESAELVAEAVVASNAPAPGRTPNAMDPARVLHLRLTKVIKGKSARALHVKTVPCYVAAYEPGRLVTLVRLPGGEYHVVERPQR
jgi:hypothetical protein